jgi:hypothetical protein
VQSAERRVVYIGVGIEKSVNNWGLGIAFGLN